MLKNYFDTGNIVMRFTGNIVMRFKIYYCTYGIFVENPLRRMSFLDVALAKALTAGLTHDTMRKQSLRPSPSIANYFVLSKDPKAWNQFKEDGRKENLVFCMEFIDEDTSSTVFIDLAREFDGIPFVRVQVGQGIEGSFEEVCPLD